MKGFFSAVADNLFGTNLVQSVAADNVKDFNSGATFGNQFSVGAAVILAADGAANVGGGTAVMAASVAVTGGTGGLSIAVSGPTLAAGAGMTVVGGLEIAASKNLLTNGLKNSQKGEGDKKVEVDPENKIPRDQLNPPDKSGNAPTFKEDGTPVEIHHEGQSPNGPYKEMNKADHRLGPNYRENHPAGQKPLTKEQRQEFNRMKREYWKQEYPKN